MFSIGVMILVLEISTIGSMSPTNAQDDIQGNKHWLPTDCDHGRPFCICMAWGSVGAYRRNDGRGG